MKEILYGVTVACFVAAGVLDVCQGHLKLGVVAIGFGIMNALIFFWRT